MMIGLPTTTITVWIIQHYSTDWERAYKFAVNDAGSVADGSYMDWYRDFSCPRPFVPKNE